jgi:hypothetical protein
MFKKLIGFVIGICLGGSVQAQVLISLVFGDALNTDKIEFGLTGGFNRTDFNGTLETKPLNNFNLGFYFHIMLKENSFLSTGVLVKNSLGATGMKPYELGDPNLDAIFQNGTLTTKINTFLVPIMWQQRIKQRFLLEGGIQAGLRSKAYDDFDADAANGAANFRREVGDEFYRLDAGLIGGVGYKLTKELKSMSIGMLYYYGLVDVRVDPNVTSKNTSLNVYMRIPIGAGSKE